MDLTRRGFIGGAAASAAAGIACAAAGAGAAAAQEAAEAGLAAGQEGLAAGTASGKWAFEIAPEGIDDSQVAETLEADVVVVGAGTGGLMAANSAIDEGLSVILVSASEKPVARGGSNNAVYCKAFEEQGIPRTDLKFYRREMYNGSMMVDQRKWYEHYNNSEAAMDYAIGIMEDAGYRVTIELGTPMKDDSLFQQSGSAVGWDYGEGMEEEPDVPHVVGMMQPLLVRRLAARLAEQGGQLFYKNIARQLVRGGAANGTEGRVDAVICERDDGTFAKYVGHKAVVLATGDFSANRDMMAKYAPEAAKYISDDVYDAEPNYDVPFQYGGLLKGDGQRMGLWVGAAWQKSYPNCVMGYPTAPGPYYLYGNHFGLQLDRFGKRYGDEYTAGSATGIAMTMQAGGEAYAIWDSDYMNHQQLSASWDNDSILDMSDPDYEQAVLKTWDDNVESGVYVKGDTVEDVVAQLGLPERAVRTVEEYNEMCAAGEDSQFHKDPDFLWPIEKGPFYGQKCTGFDFLTILGGLRTNEDMQVCDEDDEPIPGLYNVGSMVGDVFHGIYTFQVEGGCYGMCGITFGYLAGKRIAENER